ncbi:MAG: hydrogenase maturation protease [Spirochaetales bacterium]|nr:hydrogenase maturation protease [Spirochaetales bacterium]
MMERNKKETLILGVGNPLRRDDGIGPAVIQLLEKKRSSYEIPSNVELIDGGTDGLGLIEYLKDYKKVIIIDAVESGVAPGTIKVFTPEEAVLNINSDSLSTHGFGIAELIKLAKELDINPKLVIVGVQPGDVSYGEGLSDILSLKMEEAAKVVVSTTIV